MNMLLTPPLCVEGLCDEQIHCRLAEERDNNVKPVRFNGQHLHGYHWWILPNYDDGVYSSVYARVNVVGDLVVGTGEDTHLVCITNGNRLTLSQNFSDAVVSASDERLLVCL